ncbi:MAG: hypothetical protein AAGM22_26680 [Acidobacteriota bacterium]
MARSTLKWIGIGAAALFAVIVATAVLLLTRSYDSETLGERLLNEISGDDFRVSAEGFDFHPLSGLEMTGVQVWSAIPDGTMTAAIDKIIVTHEVRPMLTDRLIFREIVLERPAMDVVWTTAPAEATGGGPGGRDSATPTSDPGGPADAPPPAGNGAEEIAEEKADGPEPTLAITRFAMVGGHFDMRDQGAESPTVVMENFDVELRDFTVESGVGDVLARLTSYGDLRAERMVTPVAESTDARGKIALQNAHVLLTQLTMPMAVGDMVFDEIDVDLAAEPFTYRVAGAGTELRTHVLFGAKSGFGPARLELEMNGEGTATTNAIGGGRLVVGAGSLGQLPILSGVEKLVIGSNLVGRAYEPFEVRFRLGDEELHVEPFDVVSGRSRMRFGGSVALAGGVRLETVLDLPREGLALKALPKEVVEVLTDTDGRVKLPIVIGGTAEVPEVQFDRRAWGELLKRRAAKEVEKKIEEELTKALGKLFAGSSSR